MAARVKISGDVGIIRVSGRLVGGPETQRIREDVSSLLEEVSQKILLDYSRVQWMNSSGLGMLMATYSAVKKKEGRIGLVRVPEHLHEVMQITRVHKLFEMYPSIQQALCHFKS